MTTDIDVELLHARPDSAESLHLSLPEGSTVAEALARARLLGFRPAEHVAPECLAIFGRAAGLATRLHAGDRIELLRPLLADPKQRRRERAGGKRPR